MWIYFFLFILCSVDGSHIEREQCINSKWTQKNTLQCHKFQEVFVPECSQHEEEYLNDYCVHYSPPNPKSSELFNIPIESINDTLRIAKLFKNITEMWLPIIRREKYDKFVWLKPYAKEKNKIYQHPLVKESNKEVNNTYNYDCIAATNITVFNKSENEFDVTYIPKIVNCSFNYPTVYAYKKVNRYFLSNTKTEKYGSPLFYSTNGNKGFYIHNRCKNIAEPRNKEDNFLIKQLVQNRTCRIGIKYDKKNRHFLWESTNKTINYTDWVLSTQFDFDTVVINSNGWSLNDSKLIQCYVCEIDRSIYATDLILIEDKDKLTLTAYSFDELYYSFVCQVDGLDDFQYNFTYKNVDVPNEFDPNYNQIENVYKRMDWKLLISSSKTIMRNHIHCSGSLYLNKDNNDPQTKKVFIGRPSNSEFAFIITFKGHCKHHICDPYLNGNFTNTLPKIFDKVYIVKMIRAMRILKIDKNNGDIELLYHTEIESKINLISGYVQLAVELKKLKNNSSIIINLDSLKYCQGCLPNKITVDNVSLHWNFTEIGATAFSDKCIQSNYLPVTRKCTGNFLFGGKWMNVLGSCNNTIQVGTITKKLNHLRNEFKTMSITNISDRLANLTQNSSTLQPMDVVYISEIFKSFTSNLTNTDNTKMIAKDVSKTISNLVAIRKNTLKLLTGTELNPNKQILTSIESIFLNLAEKERIQVVEPNFMCQLSSPVIDNITGIALIRPNTTIKNPSFSDYRTKPLTADTNITKLIEIEENLEAAAFIPRILYDKIIKESENKSVKINMMFYYNDSLFIDPGSKTKVLTKIFSISISDYKNQKLFPPVPVIFRNFDSSQGNKFNCGYWDFEVNGSGKWINDVSSKYEYFAGKHVQICNFSHLTNFALLLGFHPDGNKNEEITKSIKFSAVAVTYMTAVGSILSIIGIFVIFTSAAVFKYWRKMALTKIILNVSICFLLQIVLLYGNIKISRITCIVTGTLLHYTVLSGFMWSLIMAYLQYWRFVKVLGNPTSHLISKAIFVGWILPMIPVAIVHIIDSNAYIGDKMHDYNNDYICYPNGIILYTTVYLPVATIVTTNLIIFFMIIYNVYTHTKSMSEFQYNYDQRKIIITEVKLGVFLFFSLSLTWIFGFLALSQYCDFCVYIFVLTASSQGFMLFVYYILFNRDIRLSWTKLIKTERGFLTGTVFTATASKSNLTNEENEMDTIKKKNQIPQNESLQSNSSEEKTKETYNINDNFQKKINPLNQDCLRKRVKKETNDTDEKQNSCSNFADSEMEILQAIKREEHNYKPMKNNIEISDTHKNEVACDIAVGEEATTKKKYNPEKVGSIQPKINIHELTKQQEKRNSPFNK